MLCLEGPIQENQDYFSSSVFIYADMDPIYAVPTFLLTDDFTEWAVYLENPGQAFVAFCVCVCVSMRGDNVFSSD